MDGKGYTKDGSVDLRGRPVLAANTGRWRACAFLVGYEAFERMAFNGIAANLVVYLTTQLHEDTISSLRNVNNWSGVVWMTPIVGAYIADSYLGRFWTLTVASLLYVMLLVQRVTLIQSYLILSFVFAMPSIYGRRTIWLNRGMVLLTLAVALKTSPVSCINGICDKASASEIAFFYTSLYVIAIGAGGTKPNISTFGADQFDDFDPQEKKLKASFFNWWMFSVFLGTLFATVGLVYIQENLGWGLGYGIPTVGLLVSLILFYIGTPTYRHKVRSTKNPTRGMLQVWVSAFKNRKESLPVDPSDLYELDPQHYIATRKRRLVHSRNFRFLDKAALKEGHPGIPCPVTQVEEAKLVLGMIIIWIVTLIPSTIWAQVNTLFVKQGTTMNRNLTSTFKIPAASLGSFITLSMLISVPIYDRYFVPFMRQRTKIPRGVTLLQRLGIGIILQILSTAFACFVEVKRIKVIEDHHIYEAKDIVPMSIFWLLPQYILLGIADVFNCIGLLEFFYDQSPDEMQSLGTTFFTSGIGVGNFLNSFLVTVVDQITGRGGRKSWIGNNLNNSRLDYYYGFLTILSVVNMVVYFWVSLRYHYKEEAKDMIEGKESVMEMEVGRLSSTAQDFQT